MPGNKVHDPLDEQAIRAALDAAAGRFRIEVLAECESTNTVLLDQAQAGAEGGAVVACERQTAGRGRRGRNWLSTPEDSLTFSVLWHFPRSASPLAGLSLAVGVAAARALERIGAAGVRLKWPNDILVGDGKLGGILVETMTMQERVVAVVGIGLNVRLPASLAGAIESDAAGLDALMAEPPSRNRLLAALLDELADTFVAFSRSGFAAFVEAWRERHAYGGRAVRILAERADAVEGRCAGVDHDGALLLETADGLRRILSGEVSLRPA